MKFVEAQLLMALARAQYWQTLITSGAYKLRKTQRATAHAEDGTFTWRDCTDEEKLEDALGVVQRHIDMAQSCVDYIGEQESK